MLDDHDFEMAMNRYKEALARNQSALLNFRRNWNRANADDRRALARDLNAIYRELGEVSDNVLGNYPKRGFPLFAAI